MGMEAGTLALVIPAISSILGPAIGGALSPNPYQQRQSFEGSSADPTTGMTQVQDALRELIGTQADKVGKGVTLQSTVDPTLPTFTGGGLPMPIGVKPGDPSLAKPFSIPGIDVGPVRKAIGGTGQAPGTYRTPSPNATPVGGPGSAVPRPPGQKPGTSVPPPPNVNPPSMADPPNPQPGNPGGGAHRNAIADPTGQGVDPTAGLAIPQGLDPQTYGALQLLMHSMQGGGGTAMARARG